MLPYAALNRPAFGGLRGGNFASVQVHITEAWDLARVRPLFGRNGTTLPQFSSADENQADRYRAEQSAFPGYCRAATLQRRRRIRS